MSEAAEGDLIEGHLASAGSLFEALRTVRSRRVGNGYRIDSGTTEQHPVTGRTMHQEPGPNAFVSTAAPRPLTVDEEALLAWAAIGPNGVVAWDLSMDGGFHELMRTLGRTIPHPGNTSSSALLVINDDGVSLYDPRPTVRQGQVGADDVRRWYADRTRISPERPDIDGSLRLPGAPDASLMGPYQYNVNRPGSTWFLPITDAGRIFSSLLVFLRDWRQYPVDDLGDGSPLGVGPWLPEGYLQMPVPLSSFEQRMLTIETYPTGAIVQNIRLASEAMGLGSWSFCGFLPEVVLGGLPMVTEGLGFTWELNRRAPLGSGAYRCLGLPGVFDVTAVPSPRYPDGRAVVDAWHREKHGEGGWADPSSSPLVHGHGPWSDERGREVVAHPAASAPGWVWDAAAAIIDDCVERHGAWPVTFNPLQAQFGTVAHHLDLDFYDQHYRPEYVTARHRDHGACWHGDGAR